MNIFQKIFKIWDRRLNKGVNRGDLELLRKAMKKGANVNALNRKSETPLNLAIRRGGNLEIVKELLT